LEAKESNIKIESSHYYHSAMLGNIPFVQIVKESGIAIKERKNFYCISASRFFG
jgi:hypothetical protein